MVLGLLLVSRLAFADEPTPMREGQPAPADGVFLSTRLALSIYQDCELSRRNADALEKALVAAPQPAPVGAVVLAGSVGLVVGAGLVLLLVRR